jgi:hypothetical protein
VFRRSGQNLLKTEDPSCPMIATLVRAGCPCKRDDSESRKLPKAAAGAGGVRYPREYCDSVALTLYRGRPVRHTVYEALIRILQCNIAFAK